MGNMYTAYIKEPDVYPRYDEEPTFDPMYGFPGKRKERVMIATEAEMEAAKLELKERDYCAHLLLNYQQCLADVYPFPYKCHHPKHIYMTCQYEDYVLRMKEFERERRLRKRQKRKQQNDITFE